MKMFNADKNRMIGLPYGEKNYDNMLSRFHPIPERNGSTDRRTDRFAISISRVSMLTRNKNSESVRNKFCFVRFEKKRSRFRYYSYLLYL